MKEDHTLDRRKFHLVYGSRHYRRESGKAANGIPTVIELNSYRSAMFGLDEHLRQLDYRGVPIDPDGIGPVPCARGSTP